MIVTVDTACGREVRAKAKDVSSFYWGSTILCCDSCRSIVTARNSWGEVYA